MKPALALITFLAILALCLRLVAATATVDERAPATLATMQRFPSSSDISRPASRRPSLDCGSPLLPHASKADTVSPPSGGISSSFIFTASFESWTNATFATWLCGNLSVVERELEVASRPLSSLTIRAANADINRGHFLLPDCFFGRLPLTTHTDAKAPSASTLWPQLKSLSLSNVLIAGNQHHPNPITRLAKPALNLETLSLTAVALVNASGTAACIDLDESLSELSTITELVIKDSRLGSGTTLPTLMRSRLVRFDVSGSLPIEVVEQAADMTDPKVDVTAGQSWSARETQKAFDKRGASATLADSVSITLTSANSSSDIANAICNADARTAWIQVQSGSFSLPSCTASTFITTLTLSGMNFPDVENLPLSLVSLLIQNCLGHDTTPLTIDMDDYFLRFSDLKSLSVSQCGLVGTMLTRTQVNSLSLWKNELAGTLSPSFFANSPNLTSFYIPNNKFTGTFPWYGLGRLAILDISTNNFTHWPSLDFATFPERPVNLLSILAQFNPYLSEIPSPASWTSTTQLATLDLHGCPLLAGQQIPFASAAVTLTLVTYDITGCGLIGSLPELPDKPNASLTTPRYFRFGDNQLSGTIPMSWSNYSFYELVLSNNNGITGTLPPKLFGPARLEYLGGPDYFGLSLRSFKIDGTSLSGPMTFSTPDYHFSFFAGSLALFAQNAIYLDFCGATPLATWNTTYVGDCNLRNTSAYYCQGNYASTCLFSVPPPPSLPPPTPTPTMPTTPPQALPQVPTPTITPPSPPTLLPSPCDYAKRPSDAFVCIGTSWTLFGTFNESTLIIPSGGSEVIVVGDVTSSSVVIAGLGSTLVLQDGCATNLTSVTIELTPDEIKRLGSISTQLLVSTNSSSNCSDLSNVNIYASVRGDSCKKASAKSVARGGQLSALFTIDSSRCRTWWIILVAVLASVVVILVVVFVLLVIFVRPVREMVRPYSKRNKHQGDTQLN